MIKRNLRTSIVAAVLVIVFLAVSSIVIMPGLSAPQAYSSFGGDGSGATGGAGSQGQQGQPPRSYAPPLAPIADGDAYYSVDEVRDNIANEETGANPNQQEPQSRIIIKNATMNLVVKDTDDTLKQITQLTERVEGWVVTSNTSKQVRNSGTTLTYGQISIRVPVEQFVTVLDNLKAMAVIVNNENVSGDDVTAQYVDLKSELSSLEAAEIQLNKIMESATTSEAVLAAFNQIREIRRQIDVIKGRLKFYDESAAFSLINISLSPEEGTQPIRIAGWSPDSTFNRAIEALVRLLQLGVDLVIWSLVVVLPIALPIVIVVLIVRRFQRRNRPVAPVPSTTPTEG